MLGNARIHSISTSLDARWDRRTISIVRDGDGFLALIGLAGREASADGPQVLVSVLQRLDAGFADVAEPIVLEDRTPAPVWNTPSVGVHDGTLLRVGDDLMVVGWRTDLLPGVAGVPATARIDGTAMMPAEALGVAVQRKDHPGIAPFSNDRSLWALTGAGTLWQSVAGRAGMLEVRNRQAGSSPGAPDALEFDAATGGVEVPQGWLFVVQDAGDREAIRFALVDRAVRGFSFSDPHVLPGLPVAPPGGLDCVDGMLVFSFSDGGQGLFAAVMSCEEALGLLVHEAGFGDAESGEANGSDSRSMLLPGILGRPDVPALAPFDRDSSRTRITPALTDVGVLWTYSDDREIGGWLRDRHTWGVGESRFMQEVVRPGMNVLDVGANIGYCSVLLSRLTGPRGKVLAIEPEPANAALLRANLALSGAVNVEALQVAVSREPTMVSLRLEDAGNRGGFLSTPGTGTIPAWPLDELIDPELPIGFIKIDVEGADHMAVEGLARTIRRWRPVLLVEFNPHHISLIGESPEAALALYQRMGLRMTLLGESAVRLIDHGGVPGRALLESGLAIEPANFAEFADQVLRVGLVNLALWPLADG